MQQRPTTLHKRHIYIQKQLNPFGPDWREFFRTVLLPLPQHKSYTLCELWSVGVYHSSVPFRTAVHDVLYKMEQFLAINSYTRRERDAESCDQEAEYLWKLSTVLMFAVQVSEIFVKK